MPQPEKSARAPSSALSVWMVLPHIRRCLPTVTSDQRPSRSAKMTVARTGRAWTYQITDKTCSCRSDSRLVVGCQARHGRASEVASCETYLQNFTANLRGWLHASAPSTNFGQIEPLRYHMARSPFLRSALDGDVGLPELALGPVAHRVDYGAPRGGCCDDGYRGSEDTVPTGSSRI